MRRDHNSGIPHGQSSPWSCQSFCHSIWQSLCQSKYPPPEDGETGVCLPSSPSHIWIKKSALVSKNRVRARAAPPLPIFLLFLMLAAICCTPVTGADDTPPPLELDVDHDEADTWSSVLVTIRFPPFIVNNTTYYTDREVRLTLKDLDEQKVLLVTNVNVTHGIGVFNFRILPAWGEFVMEIKVLDHNLTGETVLFRMRVVYSTDYALYIQALTFLDIAEGTRADSAASNLRQERMTQFMFLIVFTLVPITLLRLEHRSSRRLGRSSFWDRLVDRHFNYTIIPPALWHYIEDDRYDFPTTGRKAFRRLRLEFGRDQVQADVAALTGIERKLDEEIERLTEDLTGEKGDDTEGKNAGHAS